MCVCVCVCVCERDRERRGGRELGKKGGTEGGRDLLLHGVMMKGHLRIEM